MARRARDTESMSEREREEAMGKRGRGREKAREVGGKNDRVEKAEN